MNFFENLFQSSFGDNPPPPPPPDNQRKFEVPPASCDAIASLKEIRITVDDIQEISNQECVICLATQSTGELGVKLDCGHLFHRECITHWLASSGLCPVCKFELPSVDIAYESERQRRMKKRVLRYKRDDLLKMSVSDLRSLCNSLLVSIEGCVDKSDIIAKLIDSKKVVVVEKIPPVDILESDFNNLKVKELKKYLDDFGIQCPDAVEKSDIRRVLLESGRINIVVPSPCRVHSSGSHSSQQSSSPSSSFEPWESTFPFSSSDWNPKSNNSTFAPKPSHSDNVQPFTVEELRSMSIGNLKAICKMLNLDTKGIVEKESLIERIMIDSSSPVNSPIYGTPTHHPAPETSSIQNVTLAELRQIANALGLNISDCVEKNDIIDKINRG